MQAQKILISWIGDSDIRSFTNNPQELGMRGPLLTCLEHFGKDFFHKVLLLHTGEEGRVEKIAPVVAAVRSFAPFEAHSAGAIAPTDLESIYNTVCAVLKKLPDHAELHYNLSSGTPAMYATTLSLSMHPFTGKAYYTVEKRFSQNGKQVFPVALPFSLPLIQSESTPTEESFVPAVNQKIYDQARYKVAPTEASVLILGETGVGKSHLAECIHTWSKRASQPFVSINCAEVAGDHNLMRSELFGHKKGSFTGADKGKEGAFSRAHGGTLFLDEVGEIPLSLQGMLLRALEKGEILPLGEDNYKKVHVRIIAATNKNLFEEIQAGRFREDLYYRLAHYAPRLHAVREYSREDKEHLLDFLLRKINADWHNTQQRTLSPQAKEILLRASWPGNIREMFFRLQSICLLSDTTVQEEDVLDQLNLVSQSVQTEESHIDFLPANVDEWLKEKRLDFIERAIASCKTEKEAAQRLGIDKGTMRSFVKKYQKNTEE